MEPIEKVLERFNHKFATWFHLMPGRNHGKRNMHVVHAEIESFLRVELKRREVDCRLLELRTINEMETHKRMKYINNTIAKLKDSKGGG